MSQQSYMLQLQQQDPALEGLVRELMEKLVSQSPAPEEQPPAADTTQPEGTQ